MSIRRLPGRSLAWTWLPAIAVWLLLPAIAISQSKLVPVPNLKGASVAVAKQVLAKHQLQLGQVVTRPASDAPPGTVIDQKPRPDERVPAGTSVNVLVAQPPEDSLI